jgi:hypothetical protein
MRALARHALLLIVVSGSAACGGGGSEAPLPPLVGNALRVSGGSPYPSGCSVGSGQLYRGAEVEPSLAVDPLDANHLVGAWQQDRLSNGGAAGLRTGVSLDGGATWTVGGPAFTHCSGGTSAGHGDYQRSTDPWVTVALDGTVHLAGYSFDVSHGRQAVVASRSSDGGLTWSAAQVVASDSSNDIGLDKETITANPAVADTVYLTWDRLAGLSGPASLVTGPAWFSRSLDGGVSWEAPRIVYDPGANAQTIGNIIVVLPDGTLLDLLARLEQLSAPSPVGDVVVVRSTDDGDSWSDPIVVSSLQSIGVVDPKTQHPVRTGDILPSIAVDPVTGAVWVAWQDARFSSGARDGIVLAHSEDGGQSWSTPVQVNQATEVQAFTPVVAVDASGAVAVSYYDLRHDTPSDPGHLWATGFVVRSADGSAPWTEAQQGEPFDLRRAPNTSGSGWFLGDYTGLAARAGGFTALMVFANDSSSNPTDAFISQLPAPVTARTAEVQRNERPLGLAERARLARQR